MLPCSADKMAWPPQTAAPSRRSPPARWSSANHPHALSSENRGNSPAPSVPSPADRSPSPAYIAHKSCSRPAASTRVFRAAHPPARRSTPAWFLQAENSLLQEILWDPPCRQPSDASPADNPLPRNAPSRAAPLPVACAPRAAATPPSTARDNAASCLSPSCRTQIRQFRSSPATRAHPPRPGRRKSRARTAPPLPATAPRLPPPCPPADASPLLPPSSFLAFWALRPFQPARQPDSCALFYQPFVVKY